MYGDFEPKNGDGELADWQEPLRVSTLTNQLQPPPTGSMADAYTAVSEEAAPALELELLDDASASAPEIRGAEVPGLAEAIANGPAGDLVARLGIPRGVAPVLLGVAFVVALARSVQVSAEAQGRY